MVVLEKILQNPLDYKGIKPSILKEIYPEYSLEELLLLLKLQNFGHLMWRVDSLEKTPMLGKIEGRTRRGTTKGWDGWMASSTQWTWIWANSTRQWRTGNPGVLLFSQSFLSICLWPHGLQHASLPCPSPSLRACSNSCPLSRWCHPTISSSVIPFSSCLQSFPTLGTTLWFIPGD